MTAQRAPTVVTHVIVPHTALSRSAQLWIFLYLGTLVFLLAFGGPSGGLIDIPIGFFLKNKLHLTAKNLADFRLVAAIPVYLSFVFGFIRDIWNPFGMNDRGFILLFGAITAALYIVFAFTPVSTITLLIAVVVLMTSYLFVASAQNGLASTIGQQHAISGQISAVWNICSSIPNIAAFLLGGSLSSLLEGTSDFALFRSWCEAKHVPALPAATEAVAAFLAAEASRGTKASTIGRRLAAIRYAHKLAGHEPPTNSEAVKATLRGIRRTVGSAPARKAPATADKVLALVAKAESDLKGLRDRAIRKSWRGGLRENAVGGSLARGTPLGRLAE